MRVNSLDYLRGLMAILIMVYHYFTWTFSPYDSSTFLGIFGVYGVSTFYVLSGLTLYLVYNESLTLSNTKYFFFKRIFRIYPLLLISTFLTIVLLNKSYDTKIILLNISGLFGFVAPDKYISTGAWSIGNELFFYSLFPLFILGSRRYNYFIEVCFLISLLISFIFAFFILSGDESLMVQWKTYINPFNQLFLFLGGICIGKYVRPQKNNLLSFVLLAFAFAFVIYFPVAGNRINILIQWNRLLFSIMTFCITISFFKFNLNLGRLPNLVLVKVGHISYSVYLIHPIVFWYLSRYINRKTYQELFLTLCFFITILLSWFTYRFFEAKLIQLGKFVVSHSERNEKFKKI